MSAHDQPEYRIWQAMDPVLREDLVTEANTINHKYGDEVEHVPHGQKTLTFLQLKSLEKLREDAEFQ